MAKKAAKKAAKKQPPLVVWVARDAGVRARYGLFLSEPYIGGEYYYGKEDGSELVSDLCPKHFESMMGVKVRPGQKRQFVWTGSPLKPYTPVKSAKRKATKRAK